MQLQATKGWTCPPLEKETQRGHLSHPHVPDLGYSYLRMDVRISKGKIPKKISRLWLNATRATGDRVLKHREQFPFFEFDCYNNVLTFLTPAHSLTFVTRWSLLIRAYLWMSFHIVKTFVSIFFQAHTVGDFSRKYYELI